VDHQGTGSVVCSCIVDGVVVGGFDGGGICVPSTALENEDTGIINAECGWNLAY
jgi:hypothetical protein